MQKVLHHILNQFGLSPKEIKVYLTCLRLGPSSVRKIAEESGMNRGTTYDYLKSLKKLGLVNYYNKKTHNYFWAEDPKTIQAAIEDKQKVLEESREQIKSILPELLSVYHKAGEKPTMRYYEGFDGIKKILREVLDKVEKTPGREYYVFSSSVRNYLYKNWKGFNRERLKRNIKNKVISLGSGGEIAGLDQRKWLTKNHLEGNLSYVLIYDGHVAMISVNKDDIPVGVVMEDRSTYETQKMIFEFIWNQLS